MIFVFFLAYLIIFLYLCTMFLKKQIIAIVSMKAMVVICIALCACTPRSLREAQEVVAQADSLWHEGKMYGMDEGDSATLAQAYEKLKELSAVSRQLSDVSYQLSEVCPFVHRTSLLCTYAHACYHYGKLLRAKDNPVKAMQVFIDATHSHTKDYHILGRVYNNIGDMCHLAGEFQLSYDMFERSADMFLQDGDTLSYYYALNDMAFELAEQGKKGETLALLSNITETCTNIEVLAKSLETKARVYLKCKQYDSTLYYSKQLLLKDSNYSAAILLIAQAYSFLGKGDSASLYAENVLARTHELFEINNALYILTQNDNTKNIEEVRQSSADRSDVQKLIEIRQGKLSQAVQLLEQDLNRKPDFRWLYAILATLLIIGTSTGIYAYRKYNKRELLSQQVNDLLNKSDAEIKRHEQIIQEHEEYNNSLAIQIEKYCTILSQAEDFPNNIYWKDFDAMSKLINDNFGMLVTKLQSIYHLSEREIRLCILVMMCDPSGTELANLLYYGKGIRTFKNRVAHKLGTNSTELHVFLIKLAANIYSE